MITTAVQVHTPPLRKTQLKYERLKRMLLDQMAGGHLQPGDMLPPEVELAQQMGVARNTVRQAMRELELQQLIRRVRGKGTIVCEQPGGGGADVQAPRTVAGQLFGLALPELRAGMYLSLQAGMNSATSTVGANMLVTDTGQDLFRQLDALTQMVHRGVAGVAMVPITSAATPVHHLTFLRQAKVPIVFCHRRVEGVRAPLIGFSLFDMGYVAGKELARLGHRRVAMIFSHNTPSASERLRGLRAAMAEAGGETPEPFVFYGNALRADALPPGLEDNLLAHLKACLSSDRPPTGIVVSADGLASLVCLLLQKLGLSVPGDVSVIGFGDRSNRESVLSGKLQSVTVDEWKLGQIAFETLSEIQRGERSADDDAEIMMPLDVSKGDSLAPPR